MELYKKIKHYFLIEYASHSIEIQKRIKLLIYFNFIGLLVLFFLLLIRLFGDNNIFLLTGDILLFVVIISSLYFIKKKKLYYATTVISILPIAILFYYVFESLAYKYTIPVESIFSSLALLALGFLFLSLFALRNLQLVIYTAVSFVVISIHYYFSVQSSNSNFFNTENITYYLISLLALAVSYILSYLIIKLFREMVNIIKNSLRFSEQNYFSLFTNMIDGFCYLKIESDKDNKPTDALFLEINNAFSTLTGLSRENILGKRITDIPIFANFNFEKILKIIQNVTSQNEDWRKENYVPELDNWFDIYIYSPHQQYFVIIIRDINQRKQTEYLLQRRDKIMQSLGVIAGHLLSSSDLHFAINHIIKKIGEATQVSRTYIFQNHYDENTRLLTSQKYEWVAEGIEPQLQNSTLQNFSYEVFGKHLFKTLLNNQVFSGSVAQMPSPEKEVLIAQNILSIVIVPIYVENAWWGFMGFDDCLKEREWTSAEIDALLLVSSAIGSLIERRKIETQLQLAKERAEESDKLKTAFLANLSHEIRTPMNAIIGFSNMLIDDSLKTDDRQEYIALIKSSGANLMNLINDIIDIAKIESGQLVLENVTFSLIEVLNEVLVNCNREKIEKRKKLLEISLVLPETEILSLHTDPVRLKQVYSNLLSNALKFTETGGIRFGYTIENNGIKFFVSDTGIGIPKEKISLIFDRFSQVDSSYTREYGGTGLGLTISRKLVEMMEGTISVESEVGVGSTFYFTLPLDKATLANAKGDGMKLQWANKIVLIAEDVDSNYLFLNKVLKKMGIKTLWAKNGKEAVEIFTDNRDVGSIDLVLMDIQMPIMNGYEATRAIKAINPSIPVIAQTAFALENDKEKTLAAGCNDYISKPIKNEELMEILHKYLDK
ncbi:MAG: ATP-binding protein [Lentimicrobiaceae bacterium]|nr:ATP-binding protein [Lentimicrobiaceae bacterium]